MKMMKHGHLSRCKHVQIDEKYLDNNLADNGGKTDFLLDLSRQLLDYKELDFRTDCMRYI